MARLEANGKILGARSSPEAIGGFAAWVGDLGVEASDGTSQTLAAAIIRRSPDRKFEVLGRSAAAGDEDEARILASARSLQALTDPARLSVAPDRVHLANAPTAGSFRDVVAKLGPQALDPEGASILNNLGPDESVLPGQLLEIVQPGRAH